jgi:uncharacterized protein YndB with AHSA1/START domain
MNTTDNQLNIINSIRILAPAEKVWDMLTNPEQTKKYMFGCETVSDWKPGSPLLWKGQHEGHDMIYVKGHIVNIEPGVTLSYTTIDPNSDIEDIPENYLTVTYDLFAENDETVLTVTQGDYKTVEDGERRYKESYNNGEGWNPILIEIKHILETAERQEI